MNKLNIDSYKPITGFYDLRKFELSAREFVKLWGIQKFLATVEKDKEYYKKFAKMEWQKHRE